MREPYGPAERNWKEREGIYPTEGRIAIQPRNTTIIQTYMPKSDYDDEEVEKIYEDMENIMKYTRKDENLIL